MTIRLPKRDIGDKFLALPGKKRAIRIPTGLNEKFGPYTYAEAQKESFCRALFRPRNQSPPEGWIYLDDTLFHDNSIKKGEN